MLRVYSGDDRVATEKAIQSLLGGKYEVFEGETLAETDLPSIFRGTTLFDNLGGSGGKRRILLKDLGENPAVFEKVVDYVDTEHEVVIWETKIDKRSAGYKRLKEAGVELKDFPLKKSPEAGLVFNILNTALRNGPEAVKMCEKIELTQDPYMFFGLMVTQGLKKFEEKQGAREKKILKELAKLDLQMKTTAIEPWMLVKAFLLRVSEF